MKFSPLIWSSCIERRPLKIYLYFTNSILISSRTNGSHPSSASSRKEGQNCFHGFSWNTFIISKAKGPAVHVIVSPITAPNFYFSGHLKPVSICFLQLSFPVLNWFRTCGTCFLQVQYFECFTFIDSCTVSSSTMCVHRAVAQKIFDIDSALLKLQEIQNIKAYQLSGPFPVGSKKWIVNKIQPRFTMHFERFFRSILQRFSVGFQVQRWISGSTATLKWLFPHPRAFWVYS